MGSGSSYHPRQLLCVSARPHICQHISVEESADILKEQILLHTYLAQKTGARHQLSRSCLLHYKHCFSKACSLLTHAMVHHRVQHLLLSDRLFTEFTNILEIDVGVNTMRDNKEVCRPEQHRLAYN